MTDQEKLFKIIRKVRKDLRSQLAIRLDAWEKMRPDHVTFSVVGALLARQVTLTVSFLESPACWTFNTGHLFHRAQADLYITLSWILLKPDERALLFVEHGIGQLKLENEHRTFQAKADGRDPDEDEAIKANEAWMHFQKHEWLIDINLGNWAGMTVRQMAEEAEIIAFYNYVYQPFSLGAHSTWAHVGRFNSKVSHSGLQKLRLLPDIHDFEPDVEEVLLALKYLDKVCKIFDKSFGLDLELPDTRDIFHEALDEILPADGKEPEENNSGESGE